MTEVLPILEQRQARSSLRRWLVRLLKLALVGVVLYFVGVALVAQLRQVSLRQLPFSPGFLGAALACLVTVGVVGVVIRRLLLAGFCPPPSWPAMAAISWVPLVGKYIPGKVFSVAGTVWMLRRYGVRDPVSFSLLFTVNALSMLVGLMLAIPLTFWSALTMRLPLAWLWGVLLLGAFATILHPRVFGSAGNWLLHRLRRPPLEMVPHVRNYVEPLLLMLLNWALTGAALWLIARSVSHVELRWLPVFISAAALAATVGLMAVFAPAGIGVREGIQLIVLTEILGPGPAAVAVLGMRLSQTLVEVILVSAGLLLRWRLAPRNLGAVGRWP